MQNQFSNSQFSVSTSMPEIILPTWQVHERVKVFSTTKMGKISTGVYAGFNTANHVGDDENSVNLARKVLEEEIGKPINWLSQTHSNRVISDFQPEADADGAILHSDKYAIGIQTADCLPLVVADRVAGEEVANLHCAWRGLAGGIIANAIKQMQTPVANLSVWFAPAIGVDNYEVGKEVWETFVAINPDFTNAFSPSAYKLNHYMLNLVEIAKIQLLQLGVTDFYFSDICTFADARMYSYRRDKQTGRNATLAYLSSNF